MEAFSEQPVAATPEPVAPVGVNRIDALQKAGFSPAEIGNWATQRRQILSEAGYSNEDIDHYLTGVKVPQQPAGLINRVATAYPRRDKDFEQPADTRSFGRRVLDAFTAGAGSLVEDIQGGLQGVGPAATRELGRRLGSLGESDAGAVISPDNRGVLNKTIFVDPKKHVILGQDVYERAPGAEESVPTSLGRILSVGMLNAPEGIRSGPSVKASGAPAMRANPDRMLPDGYPLSRVDTTLDGAMHEQSIGSMPKAQDFVDATKVITADAGDDIARRATGKMLTLYNEDGIHPAEILHDAQRDVTVTQAMVSKGDDLPAIYRPGGNVVRFEREALQIPDHVRLIGEHEGLSSAAYQDALREWVGGWIDKQLEAGTYPWMRPTDAGRMADRMTELVNEGMGGQQAASAAADQLEREMTGRAAPGAEANQNRPYQVIEGGGGQPPALPPEPTTIEAEPPQGGGGAVGPPRDLEEANRRIRETMSIGTERGEKGGRLRLTFEKLYTDFIDKYFPISKAVKAAEEEIGKLPTWENPYHLARMFAGYGGKADHMLSRGMFDFDSYENIGPSLKQILAPHAEDLDGFRNFLKSMRAIELNSRGIETGVDMDAARMVIAGGGMQYGRTAAELIKYQNRLSAYLRDSGVLSRKGYDAMLEANRLYVPFSRLIEDEHETGLGGSGSLQPQNPIQRIKGSDAKTIDPIETIIRNTYTLVGMAEKNAVASSMITMLKRAAAGPQHEARLIPVEEWGIRDRSAETIHDVDGTPLLPAPDEHVALPPKSHNLPEGEAGLPMERAPEQVPAIYDSELDRAVRGYFGDRGLPVDDDLVALIRTAARAPEGDEIRMFRDGKVETYRVDPEIARAMKGLNRESMGLVIKIFGGFASGVRAGAVLTPDFWGRHIFRDFMYAFTTFRGGLFSPIDMVRGVTGLVRKDGDYVNWLKSGGANISFVSLDRRYMQNSIDKLANTGLLERAWNVLGNPDAGWYETTNALTTLPFKIAGKYLLDPLRAATELAENASHLGAFKKAMRGIEKESLATEGVAGVSKPEIQTAGWIARDVAVDAARIGAKMQAWNNVSAFANITFQDSDRVIRAIKDHPVATLLSIAGGITLPTVLLWAANHDDPRYQETPQWQRDLFWIIPTGNPYNPDGSPNLTSPIFRLPKPWGMGLVFATGVERLLDGFVAQDADAGKRLRETLLRTELSEKAREQVLEASAEHGKHFVESGLHVAVPGFFPNAVVPMIEQFANRSTFTDRTLVPSRAEGFLPEYQYTPYTSELAKAIGPVIAAFPGVRETSLDEGSAFRGVARALTNPTLIENYVRGWTGTGGMYVLSAADLALRKSGVLPDPPRPTATLSDIPIIKAFTVRYPSASAQSIQDFQDTYQRNKTLYTTWLDQAQQGNQEAALKIQQIGGEGMFIQLDGYDKALSIISKTIRDTYKDPVTPPDQKRQLIDQMYYGMIQIARQGVATQRQIEDGLKQRGTHIELNTPRGATAP